MHVDDTASSAQGASQTASALEAQTARQEALARAVAELSSPTPPAPKRQTPKRTIFEQAGQSGFTPIESSLTFGAATDIAAAWDGTLWAIDAAGAPHRYDPLNDRWELFGGGVDAAALVKDVGPAIYFRGGEVCVMDGQTPLRTIAQTWPDLPASFKLGVKGAAWANDQLYLFRGGTYLSVAWPGASARTGEVVHAPLIPAEATPTHVAPAHDLSSAPVAAPLTSLLGWPQAADWSSGVIDAVFSVGKSTVIFIRGGQFVSYNFGTPQTPVTSPAPLSQHPSFQPLPSDWLSDGFVAGFYCVGGPAAGNTYTFRGPQALIYRTAVGGIARGNGHAIGSGDAYGDGHGRARLGACRPRTARQRAVLALHRHRRGQRLAGELAPHPPARPERPPRRLVGRHDDQHHR